MCVCVKLCTSSYLKQIYLINNFSCASQSNRKHLSVSVCVENTEELVNVCVLWTDL